MVLQGMCLGARWPPKYLWHGLQVTGMGSCAVGSSLLLCGHTAGCEVLTCTHAVPQLLCELTCRSLPREAAQLLATVQTRCRLPISGPSMHLPLNLTKRIVPTYLVFCRSLV